MATRREVSAGGVVCRPNGEGQLEVALIATHGGERWALPKGLVEQGEDPAETAVREVREETGLEAEIVTPLSPIDYWFWWGRPGHKARHHKVVHFFLMAWLGGDISQHDREVDDVQWYLLDEAASKLSYPTERKVLEEARTLTRQLPQSWTGE